MSIIKRLAVIILLSSAIFLNIKIDTYALEPQEGFVKFINEINVDDLATTEYSIKGHNGMKTFMSYKTITDTNSEQYQLQQSAETDCEGFRKVSNRYCVAIGTAFDVEVGQCFTVELENGTMINCIVADIKANKDTDKTNTFSKSGCCLEFLVDTKKLNGTIKVMGDCSSLCDEWDSPCTKYTVYDELIY